MANQEDLEIFVLYFPKKCSDNCVIDICKPTENNDHTSRLHGLARLTTLFSQPTTCGGRHG